MYTLDKTPNPIKIEKCKYIEYSIIPYTLYTTFTMSKSIENTFTDLLNDICTNAPNDLTQYFTLENILLVCPLDILRQTDVYGNTLLMKACAHQPQAVECLVKSDKVTYSDLDRTNAQGLNALFIACASQPDALKIILDKFASRGGECLRFTCANNWTLAMYASHHNPISLSYILGLSVCSTKYLKTIGTDGHNVITLSCLTPSFDSLKHLIGEPKCTVELFEESRYENCNVLMLLMNNPNRTIEDIEYFWNSTKCSQQLVSMMMENKTSALSISCSKSLELVKMLMDSDKCTQEFVRLHDWTTVDFVDDEIMMFVMSHDKYEKLEVVDDDVDDSVDNIVVNNVDDDIDNNGNNDIEQTEVHASVVDIEIQHASIITIDDAKTVPNERLNELRLKLKTLKVKGCEIDLKKTKLAVEECENKLEQAQIELEIEIIMQNAGINT